MQVKNAFLKGITSDVDNSMRQPDQWDFPTLNARIINRKGQGLIITNLPGNEEEFELPTGNVIIGACEYNGIIYILSHSTVDGH